MTNVPPGHLSCPDDAHLRSQVSSGEKFFGSKEGQSHREIPKKTAVYIYIYYTYIIYLCANSNIIHRIPKFLNLWGEFWEIGVIS